MGTPTSKFYSLRLDLILKGLRHPGKLTGSNSSSSSFVEREKSMEQGSVLALANLSELQVRGGIENNSKIIFLISQ